MAPSLGAEPSAPGGGLHEHLATISVSRWLILYFAGAALIAGVLYVKLATPIYRSTALIQVEEKKKGIAGLDALSALLPPESATDSEIEILRSRSLSADVVQKLSLDVVAVPRHFPLIGAAIARSHGDRDLARPPRLLSRFAWGGERINVDRLAVPPALENETLVLSASGDGRYQLFGPDGSLLLDGEAGKAAESASRSVSIFVSDLRANRGAQFLLRKMSVDDVIDNLQSDLLIFEKGRKTGIIRIELAGPDREQTVKTLNALAEAYLRQNVERKSEEAERTLEFVSSQLPDIKSRLEKAEQALNEYRSTNRTVDVPHLAVRFHHWRGGLRLPRSVRLLSPAMNWRESTG